MGAAGELAAHEPKGEQSAAPEKEHLHFAAQKLRRLVHVFVQKPACHPRGEPPHDDHGPHGPPVCPSPH